MNIKKTYIFLSIVLVLFCAQFISAGNAFFSGTTMSAEIERGDSLSADSNVTQGNTNATINFTFVLPSTFYDSMAGNITEVTFELPDAAIMNDMANASSTNSFPAGWACTGDNRNHTYGNYTCSNASAASIVGEGITFKVAFNFTANASLDTNLAWNVSIATANGSGSKYKWFTRIDGLVPQLMNVNITDGNNTLVNGSTAGAEDIWFQNNHLRTGAPLTVTGTIKDRTLSTVLMLVRCNETGITTDLVEKYAVLNNNYSHTHITSGFGDEYSTFSASISRDCLYNDSLIQVAFVLNDTFNQKDWVNDSSPGSGGGANPFVVRIYDNLLRFKSINATDGTNIRTDLDGSNSKSVGANNITIKLDLDGINKPYKVLMVYNTTGAISHSTRGNFLNLTKENEELWLSNTSAFAQNGTSRVEYIGYLPMAGNSSNTVEFYLVANSTIRNYTWIGGPYRIVIDGDAPSTPTFTVPSLRTIGLSDTITYTCTSADATSSFASWTMTLKRPGLADVAYTLAAGDSATKTFPATDMSEAGTYSVECLATDAAGNSASATTSSSQSFVVLANLNGGGSSSGGGSGGSSGGASFDVDFSGTATKTTMKAAAGVVKTFTFDGSTEHKITFSEIGDNSVTLIIQSDPIEVTLDVGESKEVDINSDGENDLKVTLTSVIGGKANIVVEKIGTGADIVKEEEIKAAEEATQEQEEEPVEEIPEETNSYTWLWIVLGVLIVLGIAVYFMTKKK